MYKNSAVTSLNEYCYCIREGDWKLEASVF